MKAILHRAKDRGFANYNWLQANYSFSFANYFNPQRQNFGALRVLNDDIIHGGGGFGEHPHKNMEIISIPLSGTLKHKDNMTDQWIPLTTGEVQVMSAGKGVFHSERNQSSSNIINLFQIWIIPDKMNVEPAYEQMTFDRSARINQLQTLVTSYDSPEKEVLKINQNARISRLELEKGKDFTYKLSSVGQGVYIMVINGEIQVDSFILGSRDALGVEETDKVSVASIDHADLLFIEVPMRF